MLHDVDVDVDVDIVNSKTKQKWNEKWIISKSKWIRFNNRQILANNRQWQQRLRAHWHFIFFLFYWANKFVRLTRSFVTAAVTTDWHEAAAMQAIVPPNNGHTAQLWKLVANDCCKVTPDIPSTLHPSTLHPSFQVIRWQFIRNHFHPLFTFPIFFPISK